MSRQPLNLEPATTALVIVDMQRYYLEDDCNFVRYFEHMHPGLTGYLRERCQTTAVPNQALLLQAFRERGSRLCFLRLCGSRPDREDLHWNFRETHRRAEQSGFPDAYPLLDDPLSEVTPALAPRPGEMVVCKQTYSPFTGTDIQQQLTGIRTIVLTGLVTSMCVETTARDAADRGYQVVQVEDAQADYEEMSHRASLYSSQGVCGGHIYSTELVLDLLKGSES